MSNSANSTWRSVCMPLWKFLAASILSNSARGSGAPVSTCAVSCCSTSHSQQKFSMNWLGSSTASHSTPEMPDTPSSSTCVSMWCRPWPNSWNSVMTSSCVSSAGRPSSGAAKLQTRYATGVCRPWPSARSRAGARRPSRRRRACRRARRGRGRTGRPACRRARCGRSARSVPGRARADATIFTSNSVSTMRNRPSSTLGSVKYWCTSSSQNA